MVLIWWHYENVTPVCDNMMQQYWLIASFKIYVPFLHSIQLQRLLMKHFISILGLHCNNRILQSQSTIDFPTNGPDYFVSISIIREYAWSPELPEQSLRMGSLFQAQQLAGNDQTGLVIILTCHKQLFNFTPPSSPPLRPRPDGAIYDTI